MIEEFKFIEGFDNKYLISNKGYVKSIRRNIGYGKGYVKEEQILKFTYDKDGYRMVSITQKDRKNITLRIHVLVATYFLGKKPKENSMVCHKNDNKIDNNVNNLYWGNYKSNTLDRYKNNNTKFSISQIKEIREMHKNGIKQNEIAKKFNCLQNYISKVVNLKIARNVK